MEPVDVTFALLGAGTLLAGILPRMLERRPLSMPITFLGLGALPGTASWPSSWRRALGGVPG